MPHGVTSWCGAAVLLLAALVLLLVLPATPRRSSVKDTKIVLRNVFLRNCPGSSAYVKMQEPHVTNLQRDGSHLIDANLTAEKMVRNVRSMEIKMYRCRDVVSKSTCEYYGTWSWKTAVCTLIAMKGMMWSTLVDAVTPKLVCPFREGQYLVRNATWDVNHPVFRGVFEDHLLWTGTFTATDQDDLPFICLEGAMQGIKVRRFEPTSTPVAQIPRQASR